MDIIKKSGNSYILRLKRGEEFISSMEDLCRENGVSAAWFEAVGATNDLEIAYYDLEDKKYVSSKFAETLEVLTISGNISLKDGDVAVHAHGIFGRTDFSTIGGHVVRCVVSATLEVSLQMLEGEMARGFDEDTGLHLLSPNK